MARDRPGREARRGRFRLVRRSIRGGLEVRFRIAPIENTPGSVSDGATGPIAGQVDFVIGGGLELRPCRRSNQ